MTTERTSFVYVTFISAPPEKVFEALTSADITSRYWGHSNVSDWQPGSRWDHVRTETGVAELTGKVVEHMPPSRLVISWVNKSQETEPEAYSRVTFDVIPYDGMTKLIVTHDDLIKGSGMEQGVSKGWPIVLSSLKSYLETGTGLNVFAKPKAA
ncbi:SRPBCC family protein [Rhodobacter sp. SY28-1]|uniref:SRPBCC family protein n=1 Tax=Rhodobacter sp. SY28-1 TaxID=2562317 RepID=UPI0010C1298B|nr:SRPBCC family protein [Rhodobacter sp. SY28-1]